MRAWFLGLGLFIFANLFFNKAPEITFLGGDGKAAQAMLLTNKSFSQIWATQGFTPLQGICSPSLPYNLLLNPTYFGFLFKDKVNKKYLLMFSNIIGYAVFSFGLGLFLNLFLQNLSKSFLFSSCSFLLFSPFLFYAGFNTIYCLNPSFATITGFVYLLLFIVIKNELNLQKQIFYSIFGFILFLYICYIDPISTVFILFCLLIVLFPIFIKLFIYNNCKVKICLFFALSLFFETFLFLKNYYSTFTRVYFQESIHHDRIISMCSFIFSNYGSPKIIVLLFLFSTICILYFKKNIILIKICAVIFIVQLGLIFWFLFGKGNYPFMPPLYIEQPALGIFLATSFAGFYELAKTALKKIINRNYYIITMFCVVYLIFCKHIQKTYLDHIEPWPKFDSIVNELDFLNLKENPLFRGSVCVKPGIYYQQSLLLSTLWKNFIPTINAYTPTIPPDLFYAIHKIFGEKGYYPRNRFNFSKTLNSDMAELLGIKIVLDYENESSDPHYLVLQNPNLGNYKIKYFNHIASIDNFLDKIKNNKINTKETVILNEKDMQIIDSFPENVEIKFMNDGKIWVSAESKGRSFILLPIYFSNCLTLTHIKNIIKQIGKNEKIVRANFFMTGIFFEKNANVVLSYENTVFNHTGLSADLNYYKTLKFNLEK